MSTINTNGINVNYPVPGVNNSTQGFRDNFANIKTNLNTAATEITDLQEKVVLKQALANSTLNNDMAGTLISNATTRGFRASTYNLGNALSGTVVVDVSLGDVQYGTVAGNVTLQFGGWGPVNTESSVVLKLSVSNANAVINFPNEVLTLPQGFGVTVLENYSNNGTTGSVTVPSGVTQLDYELTTLDCGNSISITPLTRPYQTTQFQTRIPPSTGLVGDTNGTTSIGEKTSEVIVSETSNTTATINSSVVVMPGSSISGSILTVGTTDDAVMTGCYISGTTLFVGFLASGNIQVGMELTGTGVLANTVIQENLSGTGTGSTWKVNNSQTVVAPASITGSTPIRSGMLLSGTGVLANTVIVSNQTGTGSGSTWNINIPQNVSSTTITGKTGIVGSVLYVGEVSQGFIAEGTILSGLGVTANTTIVNKISGTGSGSVWNVSPAQYITPATMSGVRDAITCNDTTGFYVDMPIVFTGNTFGGIVPGTTYYIKDVMNITDFSVTLTPGGNGETTILSNETGTMYGNPVTYLYVCTQDFDGTIVGPKLVTNTYAYTNNIKVDNVVSLNVNSPILFEGSTFGGLEANVPYYIKSIDIGNSNITISKTKYNGVAGATFEVFTSNTSGANACSAYSINGSDIWKQIPLLPDTDVGSNLTAANGYFENNLLVAGDTTINGNLTVVGSVGYGNVTYTDITTLGNANLYDIFSNSIVTNTITTTGLAIFNDVSNVRIEGGFNGGYLQTDGSGNLTWSAGTGSGTTTAAAGSNTDVQYNDAGAIAGSSAFTFNNASNVLTVVGNVNANNFIATSNVTTNNFIASGVAYFSDVGNVNIPGGTAGYYLQTDGAGTLSWATGTTGTTTAAGGANKQIQYNNAGAIDGSTALTFDNTTNAVSMTGNLTAANVYANSGTIGASSLTGSLTTPAQPNVTSVGTLTSLNVAGNANVGAIFATNLPTIDPTVVQGFAAAGINEPVTGFTGAGIIIGNTANEHGAIVYGGNVMTFATENGNVNSMAAKAYLYSNGAFQSAFLTGTLTNAASNQPNIRSLGILNSLNVSGNVTSNNFIGRLANGSSNVSIPVGSGNVNISAVGNANVFVVSGTGAIVNGNLDTTGNVVTTGANVGLVGGFVTAARDVIGNLEVFGNVTGNLGIRGNTQTYTDNSAISSSTLGLAAAHAIDIPKYAAANTGVVLANAASFVVKGAPIAGNNVTITNAYALYADETSYINNLESNNISVSNVTVANTATFSDVGNVVIPGGSMGQFLQTDGSGGLTWANGTVTPSGSGTAAGANKSVQFTDGLGTFEANAGFTFNKVSGNLSVPGNIKATYINGILAANSGYQPNITGLGILTQLESVGNISTTGIYSGVSGRFLATTGLLLGNLNTSNLETSTPIGIRAIPSTYVDNVAANGSSIANAGVHAIGGPTLAASGTGITLGNAVTFLVKGEPIAGTNITITKKYAMWVDGNTNLNGNVTVGGNLTVSNTASFANVASIKIGDTGAVPNYYLQTDGNGNLQWSVGTLSAISSPAGGAGGNTQIQFNDNGNMAGSANLIFDKATNLLKVIGNVQANNANLGNLVQANYFQGDGSLLTNLPVGTSLTNGTSNVSIPSTNGNVTVSVGGTSNVVKVTTTGVNVAGTLNTGTGNANVGNLGATTAVITTGNITTVNTGLVKNGTSNVTINPSGSIVLNVAGATVLTVGAGGAITSNTVSVGSTTYTNTLGTAGQVLTTYANGVTYWSTVGGVGTSIINGTSSVKITSSGGDVEINPGGTSKASVAGNLVATGNVNAANINATNNIIASGAVSASAYIMLSATITTVSGTTKTLLASDNGKVLYFTSASAVTLTTASGLGAGYSVVCIQGGAGKITVAQGSGTTRASFGAAYNSAGQYAVISIMCPVADTFVMSGQTSST